MPPSASSYAPAGQVGERGCQADTLSGADHLDAGQTLKPLGETGGDSSRTVDKPSDVSAASAEELTTSAQLTGRGDSSLCRARSQPPAGAIFPAGF